ncbi:hypothetical protein Acsp04_44420 [Actinomadura sp. NBRC 104425]|nr:hypothetical protein Acsp04_44420 [Actinomadura sp. NBRC 104425]
MRQRPGQVAHVVIGAVVEQDDIAPGRHAAQFGDQIGGAALQDPFRRTACPTAPTFPADGGGGVV